MWMLTILSSRHSCICNFWDVPLLGDPLFMLRSNLCIIIIMLINVTSISAKRGSNIGGSTSSHQKVQKRASSASQEGRLSVSNSLKHTNIVYFFMDNQSNARTDTNMLLLCYKLQSKMYQQNLKHRKWLKDRLIYAGVWIRSCLKWTILPHY